MRAVVQRVARARVTVDGLRVGGIEGGLLVLVGVACGDSGEDAEWLARKLLSLRVFSDEQGKMNLSVQGTRGAILLVSQFTLCADLSKGARPSFGGAMEPASARPLFEGLAASLGKSVQVETGRFGEHMAVELVNDGPVTLWLDSRAGNSERVYSGRSN